MPPPPSIAYAHVGKSFAGNRARRAWWRSTTSRSRSPRANSSPLSAAPARQDHAAAAGQPADRCRQRHHHDRRRGRRARRTPIQLRRRIGYVFQSGGLFPHLSVAGNSRHHAEAARLACETRLLRGSTNCSIWCGSTARSTAIACRMSCRAGSASAFRRRARRSRRAAHRPDGRAVRRARPPDPRCARRRFSRAASQARLTTVMITHDMTEAILLGRPRRGDARRATAGAGHAGGTFRQRRSPMSANCLRTPRRQAERLEQVAAAGRRRMSLFSDPRWSEASAHLPDYLGNHCARQRRPRWRSVLSSACRWRLLSRHRRRCASLLLGLASIVQTVPGLALLALFYPLLLALAALTLSWFGIGFSAFGFSPAVLALALYSMLPVLRNTITGLSGRRRRAHSRPRRASA